jgi:hypothetical protein
MESQNGGGTILHILVIEEVFVQFSEYRLQIVTHVLYQCCVFYRLFIYCCLYK